MGKEERAYERSSVRMSADGIMAHGTQKSEAQSLKFYIHQMSRSNKGISDHEVTPANLVFTLAKSASKPSKIRMMLCDRRALMQKEGEKPNEVTWSKEVRGRSAAPGLRERSVQVGA